MSTKFEMEHNRLFGDLLSVLKEDMAKLTTKANGGRSILFVYPPEDDEAYIAESKKRLVGNCEFIDVRAAMNEFISSIGWGDFEETYRDLKNELFFSDRLTKGTFFSFLMDKIKSAYSSSHIPVLIHAGAIYGTGLCFNNIMERKEIIQSPLPLIVFYPAAIRDNTIMFLDRQPASKYRCIVIT